MSNTPPPPLDPYQLQPPPTTPVIQQAYTAHSGRGSVGPVIGVLAVITVVGAIAVMIGRLCSGRRIMGHGQYDFEGWVEAKCSSCIDGRVDPPPPRAVVVERSGSNVSSEAASAATATTPAATPQEIREEETPSSSLQSSQHGSRRAD